MPFRIQTGHMEVIEGEIVELPRGMGIYKVSEYEFVRQLPSGDVGMIRIRVKQMVSKPNGRYLAIPEKDALGNLVQARDEYIGEGDSESEALDACIARIKDVPPSDIFAKKNSD